MRLTADAPEGGAINLNIDWGTFDKALIMQKVAQFYCDYDRGAGIDLYWVNRPFKTLTTQQPIMGRPNGYRYTGDMLYFPKQGATVTGDLNGSTWISSDAEYRATVPLVDYRKIFPSSRGIYHQMLEENRYSELSGFVLLLLLSRDAAIIQMNNGTVEVRPQGPNAFTMLEDNNVPYDEHQEGSVVNISAIAEERPFDVDIAGVDHYTNTEFLDVLGYAIAHELFHLLCGPNHTANPGTVFGTGPKLSTLTTPSSELLMVNLKGRRGVTR